MENLRSCRGVLALVSQGMGVGHSSGGWVQDRGYTILRPMSRFPPSVSQRRPAPHAELSLKWPRLVWVVGKRGRIIGGCAGGGPGMGVAGFGEGVAGRGVVGWGGGVEGGCMPTATGGFAARTDSKTPVCPPKRVSVARPAATTNERGQRVMAFIIKLRVRSCIRPFFVPRAPARHAAIQKSSR